MTSSEQRGYPVVRDGTYRGHGTVQLAIDGNFGVNPVLTAIPLREIKSTYRKHKPDIVYPQSDLFPNRRPGDDLKSTDKIQSALARGISMDWSRIPSDTVREIVINALEESKTRLDLKDSYAFLGGRTLEDLEEYVREKEGRGLRDSTYLLLADLRLLPPRGQIVVLYERIIARGDPVPTYDQTADRLGVGRATVFKTVKKAGFLEQLGEQREKSKDVVIPQSQESAWVLGMLTGNSGVCKPNRRRATFSNKNEYKLLAFKRSAERVFGEAVPGIRSAIKDLSSHVHRSVVFDNTVITAALGEFGRDTKPDTIRERHGWVLNDSYIASFASGLFDSGGSIRYSDVLKCVEIASTIPVVADFYNLVLTRLGMNQIRRTAYRFGGQDGTRIQVATMQDLRRFAEKVTSVDPQTQERLDKLKGYRRKRKKFTRISSPREIVTEWERITDILGHTPSSTEITYLVKTGQSSFNPDVYARHFGTTPDGRKAFPAARDRLNSLMGSTDPAILEQIDAVPLTGRKYMYSDQEIFDEWVRIKQLNGGRVPTGYIIHKMYLAGETKIDVTHYRERFGVREGDLSPLFTIAKDVIEERLRQNTSKSDNETNIFP